MLGEHELSEADLLSVAGGAMCVWERLDSARFTADNEHKSEPEIDRRLNHWCQVAG